jgi:hypothetical protein
MLFDVIPKSNNEKVKYAIIWPWGIGSWTFSSLEHALKIAEVKCTELKCEKLIVLENISLQHWTIYPKQPDEVVW